MNVHHVFTWLLAAAFLAGCSGATTKDAHLDVAIQSYREDAVTLSFTFAKDGEAVADRAYDVAPRGNLTAEPIPLPVGTYAITISAAGLTTTHEQRVDARTKGISVLIDATTIEVHTIG